MSTWKVPIALSLLLVLAGCESKTQEESRSGGPGSGGTGAGAPTGLAQAIAYSHRAEAAGELVGPAAGSYVIVLDRSPEAAGFEKVAHELAEFRAVETIIDLHDEDDASEGGSGGLDRVFDALYAMDPRPTYVAFVVGPHRIEDTFVGRVFERATKFDDRPDVDIAYGYVTAATAEQALELVRNTRRAEEDRSSINRKFVAVGHTFREADLGLFALQQQAHMKQFGYEAEAINPIDDCEQWARRKHDEIRKLDGASLVYFAGHGAGDWLCGVDAEDFTDFTLDRAVVVNGACHSVSMLLRHDIAPPTMTIVATPIPAERSTALRFIQAGAIAQIGSTASSSWMNVGFTIPEFFHRARTVGEAVRTSVNMSISRERIDEINVLDFEIGKPSPQFLGPDRNPGHVQSISRVVLIGDPAYRPKLERVFKQPIADVPARPHPMGEPADPAPANPTPAEPPGDRERPVDAAALDEMIDALDRDIDDQFVALNLVINMGEPAVEPLLKRLESTRSWQVPKALGAIRDDRAIDPLIDALERVPHAPFSDAVVEALESITGENVGTTARQWRAWREQSKP